MNKRILIEILSKEVRNDSLRAKALVCLLNEEWDAQTRLRRLATDLVTGIQEPKVNPPAILEGDIAIIVKVSLHFDTLCTIPDMRGCAQFNGSYLLSWFASRFLDLEEKESRYSAALGIGAFIGAMAYLADGAPHAPGKKRSLDKTAEALLKYAEFLLFSNKLTSFSTAASGLLSNTVARVFKNHDCERIFVEPFLKLFLNKFLSTRYSTGLSQAANAVVNEFLEKGWNRLEQYQKALVLIQHFAVRTGAREEPLV